MNHYSNFNTTAESFEGFYDEDETEDAEDDPLGADVFEGDDNDAE